MKSGKQTPKSSTAKVKRPRLTQPMKDPEKKVESRALAKGLLVIEELAKHRRPMSLPELADLLQLGKTSTLRLLQTLVATGFAAREDSAYVLNRRWISSTTDAFLHVLSAAALPEMIHLSTETAETVSLAAAVDDHIRVIDVVESHWHIRMSNYRDRILPPYASSLGKAIAAYQTPERLTSLLRVYGVYSFTKNTITEPKKIREELHKVCRQGFAREFEETVEGGCCIGVPIRIGSEPVRAAMSISLPTSRMTEDLEASLPEALKAASQRIADAVASSGYQPALAFAAQAP